MFEYSLLLLVWYSIVQREKKNESTFQGVHNNDDIMSSTQLVNVYTYSLIVTQHEIFSYFLSLIHLFLSTFV